MKKKTHKKYRIISRKRFTITMTLVLLFVVMAFSTVLSVANEKHQQEPQFVNIHVASGDTLWDIAKANGPDNDIRKTVYEICKINNMAPEDLRPGQVIKVPMTL